MWGRLIPSRSHFYFELYYTKICVYIIIVAVMDCHLVSNLSLNRVTQLRNDDKASNFYQPFFLSLAHPIQQEDLV